MAASRQSPRIYIGDIDDAAGLGFHGSPTIRIDGQDVVPPPRGLPIGLNCRLYPQPGGGVDGVVPATTIAAYVERRREAEQQARDARPRLSELPANLSRAFFLWASRRKFLGRIATSLPFTRAMVRRFVAGFTLDEVLAVLTELQAAGLRWTVDVLGESVDSEEAATASADRYLATLDALAERGLEANVSLKLTQMGLDIDPGFCRQNVGRVVDRARHIGAFVRVDMEDHTKTEITLEMARQLHDEYMDVGVVIQSYLRRSDADIDRLIVDHTRVRLCKGAYDEPASVAFASKAEVDRSYEDLAERLLLGRQVLRTGDPRRRDHRSHPGVRAGQWHRRRPLRIPDALRRPARPAAGTDRAGLDRPRLRPYGTQWYPYYMRRLAERPANVLFILRSVLREGRN